MQCGITYTARFLILVLAVCRSDYAFGCEEADKKDKFFERRNDLVLFNSYQEKDFIDNFDTYLSSLPLSQVFISLSENSYFYPSAYEKLDLRPLQIEKLVEILKKQIAKNLNYIGQMKEQQEKTLRSRRIERKDIIERKSLDKQRKIEQRNMIDREIIINIINETYKRYAEKLLNKLDE